MKKWMLAGAMLFSSAEAQGLSDFLQAIFGAPLKAVFPAGYDATEACSTVVIDGYGGLSYTLPARFPNPAEDKRVNGDYRLICPTFTLERQASKYMRFQADNWATLYPLLELGSYKVPYLFDVSGQQFLDLTTLGEVKIAQGDRPGDLRTDLVIAMRQGNGPLVPVLFNGQAQTAIYDPLVPADLFFKNGRDYWERITLDAPKKTLTFYAKYPFPKN